jgi:hypothetical protein
MLPQPALGGMLGAVLELTNTLTRAKAPVRPRTAGRVTMTSGT